MGPSVTLFLLCSAITLIYLQEGGNATAVLRNNNSRQVISSSFLIGCVSLKKPFNRSVGSECKCNNQCASKSCKDSKCRCILDKHCPGGKICMAPPFDYTYCGATNRVLGSFCMRDDECASGSCEKGRCVCQDDGDCPDGHVCKRYAFKRNECEAGEVTSLPLGDPCGKDRECESGKCEQKTCVCDDKHDCPPGQLCVKPVFKKNFCVDLGLALGAACTKNAQCASKKCWKKECVCNDNDDCPEGKICKIRVIRKNYCKDP